MRHCESQDVCPGAHSIEPEILGSVFSVPPLIKHKRKGPSAISRIRARVAYKDRPLFDLRAFVRHCSASNQSVSAVSSNLEPHLANIKRNRS